MTVKFYGVRLIQEIRVIQMNQRINVLQRIQNGLMEHLAV